ncbi:MAG: leucine--tRNA ligase [Pseudomonadales bacterium]|jgi:leucyl-tRNA synthetase|nr:leucine--tRNA ligase [Pseudomonadales bacterium]
MEPQNQPVEAPEHTAYDAREIEARAQAYWDETRCFEADDAADDKFYCLSMFMYPSGQMHMGHVRCYTLGDVIARYNRLKGRNVLQPVGWDAFGLPAENAAIQRQVPPAKWTWENIDSMRAQFRRLGFAIDWSREFATCDPSYYRWEQWFFNRLFRKGLVERKTTIVNWDPVDQTVLANEQVENGRGWRSGALIERREMPQWTLKITAYADELLEELDRMDGWPENVRAMQRNWIGRSHGVEIRFPVQGEGVADGEELAVYTTRPDTFMGCTYVAVAAEHPLAKLAATRDPELQAFREECRQVKAAEEEIATMEKLGRPTDLVAIHPLTGAELPVWVANFVLMDYGSGAVMAVPGHDQRDWEFAKKYELPIVQVVAPKDGADEACDISKEAYLSRDGVLVNSGEYDGLEFQAAFDAIADALLAKGAGERQTNYRLRDWGVSRQRYWGCPIPMILCPKCGPVPVPDDQLPVELPTDVTFKGVASPLKGDDFAEWRQVCCPECGGPAERETDTFDTFMESSWYYARYACADNDGAMLDERAKQWCPVDQYVGGIEHAVLHLLYSRFFHKLLRDEGLLVGDEPFERLLLLGMVNKDGRKMSKSAGNVVSPDELVDRYGADATRTFMMFGAPPDQTVEWSSSGVEGSVRFLKRLHGQAVELMAAGPVPPPATALAASGLDDGLRVLRRKAHETLAKADDDYGRRQAFNTVVSAVMELSNEIGRCDDDTDAGRAVRHEALTLATIVLSPIAPHVCHELWTLLGHEGALIDARWPAVDESALARDSVQVVVQVNGKVRGRVEVPAGADQDAVQAAALAEVNVQRFVEGKTVRKVVHVPDKLLNIVVGG